MRLPPAVQLERIDWRLMVLPSGCCRSGLLEETSVIRSVDTASKEPC